MSTIPLNYIWIQSISCYHHDTEAEMLHQSEYHLLSHHVWFCIAFKTAPRTWQEQILSGKQLVGSRLQSKWEFLSGKNNETVYFYCILNEKSIDAPCVPVALYLQHNNRTAANSRLIWKKNRKAIYWLKCGPFFPLKSLRWSGVVIAV